MGAAVLLERILYFASQDTSDDRIHLRCGSRARTSPASWSSSGIRTREDRGPLVAPLSVCSSPWAVSVGVPPRARAKARPEIGRSAARRRALDRRGPAPTRREDRRSSCRRRPDVAPTAAPKSPGPLVLRHEGPRLARALSYPTERQASASRRILRGRGRDQGRARRARSASPSSRTSRFASRRPSPTWRGSRRRTLRRPRTRAASRTTAASRAPQHARAARRRRGRSRRGLPSRARARRARGRGSGKHVPVWFNEGLAIALSGEIAIGAHEDALERDALRARSIPLADLDRSFPRDHFEVGIAYAESADFMRFLTRKSDRLRFAAMIERVREGQPFERAVAEAYGSDLRRLEFQWRSDSSTASRSSRSSPAAGSSGIVVIVVLVAAYVRRRRRAKAILARWEREEAIEDARVAKSSTASTRAISPHPGLDQSCHDGERASSLDARLDAGITLHWHRHLLRSIGSVRSNARAACDDADVEHVPLFTPVAGVADERDGLAADRPAVSGLVGKHRRRPCRR